MAKCSICSNLFAEIHKQWGLVGKDGLNSSAQSTRLEHIRKQAEIIATDVVLNQTTPSNRFCKTMRKTVKGISDRYDISLKSMVKILNLDSINLFQTFENVADEIFEDGQVNWGRIIVIYAFAARVALHVQNSRSNQEKVHSNPDGADGDKENAAFYVGRYVANKLSRWIADNGGWEAFADIFSDENHTEDMIWRGLIFTATLGGLGALAAVLTR